MTGKKIKAVLIDVGGPLVDETPDLMLADDILMDVISRELDREIERDEIDRARDFGVQSWSPSVTSAILWQFLQPDKEKYGRVRREVIDRVYGQRDEVTLMEGVEELVPDLAERYILALAGNQPVHIKKKLERTGLLRYFQSHAVSEELGLSKPDTRFFLEICDRIGVPPRECCMIGDRLDNDIYPANVLGMKTIWMHKGPHAVQKPRIPEDVPDAEVTHMSGIRDVLREWEQ